LIEGKGWKSRQELVELADDLLLGKNVNYPKLRRLIFDLLDTRQ
jgi:hypothetical protein